MGSNWLKSLTMRRQAGNVWLRVFFSIKELKSYYYGVQLVVAGDALRAGVFALRLVFNTNCIGCNMETKESFGAFLRSESVTFVRDNQHSQKMSLPVHLLEIG